MKDSIKIVLSSEQKKLIKKEAVEQDTTMSDYILKLVFNEQNNTEEIKHRIICIEEDLQKNGNKMSAEQRENLKRKKKKLKSQIGC